MRSGQRTLQSELVVWHCRSLPSCAVQRVFKDKPPRLDLIFQRSSAPVYFVTFNTHTRGTVLATAEVHEAFIEYCRRAGEFRIGVGRYVLMPDHIHLFVKGDANFLLSRWMGGLKRAIAVALGCRS